MSVPSALRRYRLLPVRDRRSRLRLGGSRLRGGVRRGGAEIPITGRVLGPKGAPVAEAEVLLLPSLDPVKQARLAESGDPAPTVATAGQAAGAGKGGATPAGGAGAPRPAARVLADPAGNFRLAAPAPGLWTVRIQAPGFVPIEAALEPLIEPVDLPDASLAPDAGLAREGRQDPTGSRSPAPGRASPPRTSRASSARRDPPGSRRPGRRSRGPTARPAWRTAKTSGPS